MAGVSLITPISNENQSMKTLHERLEYCDRQIAKAIEESQRPHTEAEHVGIPL
jgi:hypothetical protein